MSSDDWSAFTHKTDILLISCQLTTLDKHKLKSKQALNFYWDLIQGCIIKATEKSAQKLEKLSKKAFISNCIPTQCSNIYDRTVKIAATLKFEFLPITV
ncbi:12384_t:CDS:2 [Funneliformis geosporum]|uniref:12384_t:CDS:1 n=1 Tax=Funneliformis geosporum TaxID=1117311 RepID=A0A9W4WQN8_9GLOM|nr:12384_t:CDS:2 [Funneliformis geosporum]